MDLQGCFKNGMINKRLINVQLITTFVQKMTTIIKSGIRTILKVFYNNHNAKVHLRELSRRTNLQGQSIMRYLNKLVEENILKFEKEGNLKKYSLKDNNYIYSLLTLFDIERFEKLPFIKKQAINYFLNNLKEKPIILFLFGSTAKETYKDNSDIDLLLIVNKKIDTSNAKKYVDSQTAQVISDFQISFRDFEKELKLKEDMVIQSAIETGYPITNHIMFYGCVNNEKI